MASNQDDGDELDERHPALPMKRPPWSLIWAGAGILIAGAAVYFTGPAWGAAFAIPLFIILLLCIGAWVPSIAPAVARTMIRWARRWPTLTVFGLGITLIIAWTGMRDAARTPARPLSAEAEQDRRDGVKITREGYVAGFTRAKLEKAIPYINAKDTEGLRLLVEQDPEIILLQGGMSVSVVERVGFLPPRLRVRIRGTLDEFWTTTEALRDP